MADGIGSVTPRVAHRWAASRRHAAVAADSAVVGRTLRPHRGFGWVWCGWLMGGLFVCVYDCLMCCDVAIAEASLRRRTCSYVIGCSKLSTENETKTV